MRARSGYRLDARIAKTAKIIDQMCPNFCPCYKSNKHWISHWLIDCLFFNHIRNKVNDKILFLYNAFNRGNLTNDIVNSINDNSNSKIVIVIIVIVIIVIVIIVIVVIVIVILVIVFLVMLVIVLKIMCILILVCLISFLEVEVLITVQGNGRIYLSAR